MVLITSHQAQRLAPGRFVIGIHISSQFSRGIEPHPHLTPTAAASGWRAGSTQRGETSACDRSCGSRAPIVVMCSQGPPGYVPVLDVGKYSHRQPREADCHRGLCTAAEDALTTAGFCVVTGHGVDPELIRRAKVVTRGFFALSLEEKNGIAHMRKGYIPVGGCSNQVRSTNLHEKWSCGRVDGIQSDLPYYKHEVYFKDPNLWPSQPPDFQEVMTQYYKEMEQLTLRLLGLMSTVMGTNPDFFVDKMDRHVTNLVALRYPAQSSSPAPGEMRARPHTDPTVLTILTHDKQPGESSGLEVLRDNTDSWESVPVVEGGLVVNVGDLLMRWSGGRFRSAKHRVVNGGDDRLAISYFATPNYDATVAPVMTCEGYHFEPILAGDISHFSQLEREKQGLEDPQLLENQPAQS